MDNRLAPSTPKDDWHGSWIWAEEVEHDRNVYAIFRREFVAGSEASLAVDITADSFYWLYIDGSLISRGPSRANLPYYTFDSFAFDLTPGRHVLAILVHHVGIENATQMLGRPGLLAEVTLTDDKRQIDLSTNADWKSCISAAWKKDLPEPMSHFGFPEVLDLQKLAEGWNGLLFSDAAWAGSVEIGRPSCQPWTRLIARDIAMLSYDNRNSTPVACGTFVEGRNDAPVPSNQATARVRTKSEAVPGFPVNVRPESYVTFDFGRTISGYAVLCFAESAPGQTIDVSYNDILTEHGAGDPERTYARLTDRYTLSGGRALVRTAHPRGFQYLTVDLQACESALVLESVYAVEETYPFEHQESFSSSDSQLDEFFTRGARTVKICSQDAFLDNVMRERVQWTEDLYLHNRVAAFAFGNMDLTRRALFQGAQGALADGRINGFFPTDRTNLSFASSNICWLMTLADYWLHTGHDDVRAVLPEAKRALDVFRAQTDERGLVAGWPSGQFWEWAPLEQGGCLIETNAALAMALNRLAAHDIFNDAFGGDLGAWADQIRAASHKAFWNPERGLYVDSVEPDGTQGTLATQDGNALAVLGGVCPPEMRRELLAKIIDPANLGPVPVGENAATPADLKTSGKIVPVGTLWFAHFLCQALFETGMDREAIEQIRMFWGPYDHLPTFPETRLPHGNIVYCQGWASGTAFLLPAYVLGVQPTGAGWSEVEFAPHTGEIEHACGVFSTPLGTLGACWAREDGGLRVSLDIPEEMRVRVRIGSFDEIVSGGGHWQAACQLEAERQQ